MRVIFLRPSCACKALLVILAVVVLCVTLQFWNSGCTSKQSQFIIESMCQSFRKQEISGNLCKDICDGYYVYDHCMNYDGGKIVIQLSQGEQILLMKSKKPLWTDYDDLFIPIDPKSGIGSLSDFVTVFKGLLFYNQGISHKGNGRSLVEKFFPFDAHILLDTNSTNYDQQQSAMHSLWTLAQQAEYVYMIHYGQSVHIPKLVGSCGHMYAMEYLPTPKLLHPSIMNLVHSDLPSPSYTNDEKASEFAEMAKKILNLLRNFQHFFKDSLHICDLKGDNLGADHNGPLKLIDLDMLKPQHVLEQELANVTCKKDVECNFFDCEGICDTKTELCTKDRKNNNLQVACTHIFLAATMNSFHGLLPLSVFNDRRLDELLRLCVFPEANEPIVPFDDSILVDLYEVLDEYANN